MTALIEWLDRPLVALPLTGLLSFGFGFAAGRVLGIWEGLRHAARRGTP